MLVIKLTAWGMKMLHTHLKCLMPYLQFLSATSLPHSWRRLQSFCWYSFQTTAKHLQNIWKMYDWNAIHIDPQFPAHITHLLFGKCAHTSDDCQRPINHAVRCFLCAAVNMLLSPHPTVSLKQFFTSTTLNKFQPSIMNVCVFFKTGISKFCGPWIWM